MKNINLQNKENRPWEGPRMYYGAIVGHTTATTTKIWIRNRYEGKYHFIVSKSALSKIELDIKNDTAIDFVNRLGEKIIFHALKDFSNKVDRTSVFNVSKLTSGARYFYYLFSDDPLKKNRFCIGRETRYSFCTVPEKSNSLIFGLYSCHDPFKKNSGTTMWKHLSDALDDTSADFVIGAGDQVYVDSDKTNIWAFLKKNKKGILALTKAERKITMLSFYQDIYRGYWGFPFLKKVHRSYPNYMIWDDHEIMDGWGSFTREELSNELDTWYEWEKPKENLALADGMFDASKEVYMQYQHSHNPTTKRNVFDYPLSQKHAEFYFFDMRGQREYDLARLRKRDGPRAKDRILGKDQLNRIFSWLKKVESSTKILYIVSPVPVIHWTGFVVNSADVLENKDDFRDEWDHESNHLERDKILNVLFEYSSKHDTPVVFLSGDVHMSAVFRLSNKTYRQAKVFQVTSSPISRPPTPGISSLILSDKGGLKTLGKENGYRYERLSKFHTRNFSILKSKVTNNKLDVNVYFYGETDDDDEVRIKKIKLL